MTARRNRDAMLRILWGEAGATPHEIAAITGHATLKEVERYTRDASRATLADSAMAKMTGSRKVLANHPARFANKSDNPKE